MALIEGIKIDVGGVLNGLGQLAKDLRTAITGEISPEAKTALLNKAIDAETQLAVAQTQINIEEAKSSNVFVSGWRPATGWVCVVALFYQYILQPLLAWGSVNFNGVAPPSLNVESLMTLLLGMLGLVGARVVEKVQGVAAK
jgi:hypothetical protein